MHRDARWHVQRGIRLRHDGGAVVPRMGIRRSAVEKTGRLSEMVAARIRGEFQNADAGRARPERLPDRCFASFRSFHYPANTESAVDDVVLPGRRSLGPETAKLTALVQDGERLG